MRHRVPFADHQKQSCQAAQGAVLTMLSECLLQGRHHAGRGLQPDDVVGNGERQLHCLDQQLPLALGLITAAKEKVTTVSTINSYYFHSIQRGSSIRVIRYNSEPAHRSCPNSHSPLTCWTGRPLPCQWCPPQSP